VSFRTERSEVRNLYILKYQFVNQISRSARNDNPILQISIKKS